MTRLVFAALFAGIAVSATAQSPSPTPSPGPLRTEQPESGLASPTPPAHQAPSEPVAVPAGPARSGDSADAGSLKGIRLVSAGEEEAVVVVSGRTLTLRPGDTIGSDVVRRIAPDRLVLFRPAPAGGRGGEATVVVQFDGSGRGRVRVYSTRDRTTPRAPEVR